MQSPVLQRFKNAVDYLKSAKIAKSIKDIGNSMGMSPSYFSEILHERIKLTADHLQIFCNTYGINPMYLFGFSENILSSTPYQSRPNRIDLVSEDEVTPPQKTGFVSPKSGKNVSPTVSPTQENCRICEEKERLIESMLGTIEAQRDSINALKSLLDVNTQDRGEKRKQAG